LGFDNSVKERRKRRRKEGFEKEERVAKGEMVDENECRGVLNQMAKYSL
jgi:hypothetical protein